MIRLSVILILGVVFGLSPKVSALKRLAYLFAANAAIIVAVIGGGMLLGYSMQDLLLLRVSTIIVSALTVLYALQLGVVIKAARTYLGK